LLFYQGAIDQGGGVTTQESSIALEDNRMQPQNISVAPSFPVDFSTSNTKGNLHQPSSSLQTKQAQEDLIVIPKGER